MTDTGSRDKQTNNSNGPVADAVRRCEIAWAGKRVELAPEWTLLPLHPRLLGRARHRRRHVETTRDRVRVAQLSVQRTV